MNSSSREEVIKSTRRRGGLGESKQIQAVWRKAKGKRSAKEVDKLEADKTRNLALIRLNAMFPSHPITQLLDLVKKFNLSESVEYLLKHPTPRLRPTWIQFLTLTTPQIEASLCVLRADHLFGSGDDLPGTANLSDQVISDETAARALNVGMLLADGGETIECECCFAKITYEDLGVCVELHTFCHSCIKRAVQMVVYDGQALATETGAAGEGTRISCLSTQGCDSSFSHTELERIVAPELYMALNRRLADAVVEGMELELKRGKGKRGRIVKCPACAVAHFEDDVLFQRAFPLFYPRQSTSRLCTVISITISSLIIWLGFHLQLLIIATLASDQFNDIVQPYTSQTKATSSSYYSYYSDVIRRINTFLVDISRSPETIFHCRNTRPAQLPLPLTRSEFIAASSAGYCGVSTCLLCNRPVNTNEGHVCAAEELNHMVEESMSQCAKRTCGNCNVSFIKSAGCNRMLCRCGYEMCFVCSAGIRNESYSHFCQHFRPFAGQSRCTECDKCDLYKEPDLETKAKLAEQEARARWQRKHGLALGVSQPGAVSGQDQGIVIDKRQQSHARYRASLQRAMRDIAQRSV